MTILESGFTWLRDQLATHAPRSSVSLTYSPPQCDAFVVDCILGEQIGGFEYVPELGDTQKVFRVPARIKTSDMITNGVTSLQKMATATVGGLDWSIDAPKSAWGPELVRLGLIRRETSRHEEMELRGSI